jgi:hypothetical protein
MSLLGPLLVHGNALNEISRAPATSSGSSPPTGGSPGRSCRGATGSPGWVLNEDAGEPMREVGADTMLHVAYWSPLGRRASARCSSSASR